MPLSPTTWLNFAVVALVVTLIPGPAFVAVLSASLRRGFRTGLYANAGIVTGDAIYFLCAALGLGSLLTVSHWAFTIVKWLGIAYLAFLGLRSLLYPANEIIPEDTRTGTGRRVFAVALSIQLANPKLLLFLAALVPQFIDTSRPVAPQFVALGATMMLSDAIVYSMLAMLAARTRRLLSGRRAARMTSRVSGLAMLGAAVRIGTEH